MESVTAQIDQVIKWNYQVFVANRAPHIARRRLGVRHCEVLHSVAHGTAESLMDIIDRGMQTGDINDEQADQIERADIILSGYSDGRRADLRSRPSVGQNRRQRREPSQGKLRPSRPSYAEARHTGSHRRHCLRDEPGTGRRRRCRLRTNTAVMRGRTCLRFVSTARTAAPCGRRPFQPMAFTQTAPGATVFVPVEDCTKAAKTRPGPSTAETAASWEHPARRRLTSKSKTTPLPNPEAASLPADGTRGTVPTVLRRSRLSRTAGAKLIKQEQP